MDKEIDLQYYSIRTDLLIDDVENFETATIKVNERKEEDIVINETEVLKDNDIKKKGKYITISFTDVTDHNNFLKVQNIFSREIKNIIASLNLKQDYKTLVVGLGNRNSTPDSLGVKVCDNIIVTRHLFDLEEASSNYGNVAVFTPNVMGNTGIEAEEIIKGIIKMIDVDLLVVVDALASSNIERVNKTIQITDTGIFPGSGVGNYRKEISKDTLGIPVIAIGVPTVVDATTIVTDTINLLIQKIAYLKNDDPKEKLKPRHKVDFLKEKRISLNDEEKSNLLGLVGNLSMEDLKSLINEVLTPIGYNMMVTPKEIDFVIEKIALLISKGINNVMHNLER